MLSNYRFSIWTAHTNARLICKKEEDRCQHVQISELFSLEMCDQAVMDFLAATEVGKFPRR
jgi:hypothetical protein